MPKARHFRKTYLKRRLQRDAIQDVGQRSTRKLICCKMNISGWQYACSRVSPAKVSILEKKDEEKNMFSRDHVPG